MYVHAETIIFKIKIFHTMLRCCAITTGPENSYPYKSVFTHQLLSFHVTKCVHVSHITFFAHNQYIPLPFPAHIPILTRPTCNLLCSSYYIFPVQYRYFFACNHPLSVAVSSCDPQMHLSFVVSNYHSLYMSLSYSIRF